MTFFSASYRTLNTYNNHYYGSDFSGIILTFSTASKEIKLPKVTAVDKGTA